MIYESVARELSVREVIVLAAIGVAIVGVLLTTATAKRLLSRLG